MLCSKKFRKLSENGTFDATTYVLFCFARSSCSSLIQIWVMVIQAQQGTSNYIYLGSGKELQLCMLLRDSESTLVEF